MRNCSVGPTFSVDALTVDTNRTRTNMFLDMGAIVSTAWKWGQGGGSQPSMFLGLVRPATIERLEVVDRAPRAGAMGGFLR